MVFISIYYDANNVYYSFDDLVQLMIELNFEIVSKKSVQVSHVHVKRRNEQVFVTDGTYIQTKLLTHDECYVDLDGLLHMLNASVFGDNIAMERLITKFTLCVVKCEHPWQKKITCYLQQRVQDSFDVYMKVCRQYFVCGRPQASRIGHTVDKLINEASQLHHSNNYEDYITAYVLYDKAIRLILSVL
ncbi:hypothetical protein HaGV_gp006 [Helicoverpa armigera granulovirus]|uniref:Uncharacterized protein n=1 Tax=Helicoverpa armigera granulovirus TaxID=489830 RepID=A9YMJ8_9BBAC|nr:hypothetical protein HaGV_gp006 [Helicoverpa armigera granulovirus]ABY47697.1 unknown [Helicoverpa armigera granulovirus]